MIHGTPDRHLTFAKGAGWTRTHQMRTQDKRSGIAHADLIRVAERFGVRAPGRIIGLVRSAVADWPRFAQRAGVPSEVLLEIERALSDRWSEITL